MTTKGLRNNARRMVVMVFVVLLTTIAAMGTVSAAGSQETADGTFHVWHYEGANSAMGIAWKEAMRQFEEMHPEVALEFEEKGFEQIRQTASMVLNSNEAPDIMEYNKGNATAGLLSSQGLLTSLTDVAEERGWDEILGSSLQVTSRYSDGVMGSGDWYGVTNYGEYVMVYYNQDMFDELNLEVPSSLAEFEEVMSEFVDEGITPIALGGSEYPAQHLFYELVLNQADQDFVDAYQLGDGEVDFHGPEMTFAADKMVEWMERGFISSDAVSMKAEDMGLDFIGGENPIMVSGSWWFGRLMDEIENFDWDVFLFPGNRFHPGSGGNLWVVPENSPNKELAYDFIDITLQEDVQTILGNAGGIPVNANVDEIDDPQIQSLIEGFDTIAGEDGLAFYPDWPVAGYYDVLVANLQQLIGQSSSPEEVLSALEREYNDR